MLTTKKKDKKTTKSSINLQLKKTVGANCETSGGDWTFKGTYNKKEWSSTDNTAGEIGRVYGFAGVQKTGIEVGDFVKVAAGAKIHPMSCYLLWNGSPNSTRALTRAVSAEELPQSITVRLVGSRGETTAIGTLDTRTGEFAFDSDGWFDMSGRRLSSKPTAKGIYINNGKKVVIK